jgi:hypothetical protein
MSQNDDRLIEIIDKNHEKHEELCDEKFIKKGSGIAVFWSAVGIGIVLIGSAMAWALSTTGTVSRHDSEIATIRSDVNDLKTMRQDIKDIKDAVVKNNK